jgi:hypothetical protein
MSEKTWIVTVFKCNAQKVKKILVDFYDFVCDLTETENLHFIIRDRVDDEVVFSFRVSCTKKNKKLLKSKIIFKLNNLLSKQNYVVDPSPDHPLSNYVAWKWEATTKKRGEEKFNTFCFFLQKMSAMTIEMVKQDYFSSVERTEIVHIMSWMIGCTEYFKLTPKSATVGYYDRIEDKYRAYLQKTFNKET